MEKREIYKKIWNTLSKYKQMIFISGPRQSGKTTFSKIIGKDFKNKVYVNWDITEHKRMLIENNYFYEELNRKDNSNPLVIFDEIHKYEDWKNYLKGVFDRDKENYQFLITGNGRLDLYQKSSDSLAGRYFLFHLWPFTLAELANVNITLDEFLDKPLNFEISKEKTISQIWKDLSNLSGFPDPFLSGEKSYYNIWSQTYNRQLIREDVRDLTGIKKIDNLEILFSILPSRIASPISMNNLARDIKVSFDSIKSWLKTFENYFITFSVSPWSKKISRSILKEKKVYIFDYPLIKDEANRFENMVAVELLRAITSWSEQGAGIFELNYVRTKDSEEVDFLIVKDKIPFLLVECKLSDTNPSKSLKKIQNQLGIPAVQLVNKTGVSKMISNNKNKICIISAEQWLARLPS